MRWSFLLGLALAIGCSAAAAQAPPADPAGSAASGAEDRVSGGPRPDFTLMYTGDAIGYLEDCGCKKNPAGGVTRRAWVVKRLQYLFPDVPILLLDSGNFSDNPTPQGDARTRTLLAAMEKLGYAVVNVGERDVRDGYDEFVARTQGLALRFVSANLVRSDTRKPVFEPRAVVELAPEGAPRKIRVGIVGVARYNPVFLKQGPEGSNIVVTHHVDSVKEQVRALEAENVDAIVVLAALHVADAKAIAEQVPGIDFILGAYGGIFQEEVVGQTAVLFCGNRGQRIADVRVFLEQRPLAVSADVAMHFLTRDYPESSEMRRFVDERTALASAGEAAPAAAPEAAAEAPRADR
jgi:2',3'-cyclic-nucleotide 2'-phosphodiesterase (5'-nucleotidase family)